MSGFLLPFAQLPLTSWWPVRGALLAMLVLVVSLLLWRTRRWPGRLLLTLAATFLLAVNVLVAANAQYGYFLTVGEILGIPSQNNVSVGALKNQHGRPAEGLVVGIDIPSDNPAFQPRTTQVYLPPAWFAHPHPQLPVVMLLHGTPGSPMDWVNGGQAARTLNQWVNDHAGVAPIVVMPDINGSFTGDSECVNGPDGDVETYLTVTVPNFVSHSFSSSPPGRNWAVAGLSEGGSCALMLALRHPGLFQTFGDYAGLAGPRVGTTNAVGDTVDALFGGSERDFDEHEPAYLLTHRRFPLLGGWFEVGSEDHDPMVAAQWLATLATRAGIGTHLVVVPGATHTFPLWSTAFANSLPWLISRLGLSNVSHPEIMAAGPPAGTGVRPHLPGTTPIVPAPSVHPRLRGKVA
jgi:S-formylglutathione hydrolase FrmB